MPLLGSDGGFQADNRGGLIDELGNTVVSSSTNFAASPLGVAARTQALYGIPNATFNLTPPDPAEPIVANQNDLPYWSIENLSDGQITATTVFDSTTQTWGVELNPGTAASGASLSLSTRSYLITDDNLALRQKAQAVLAKSGTAAVSTQWNLSLNAIYYDANDTALSTAIIGTVYDTGTWTSLAGTTTPGGSAINAAAQYVDLTFTMTTTAAVTGSAKATIKSLLLSTSSASTGSFVIAETFTANGTWTRPTGVNYVSIIACGGGGGGAGGAGTTFIGAGGGTAGTTGAGGGGASIIYLIDNIYVDAATYSVGIGAGGSGGTATTVTRPAGGSSNPIGNVFTAGSSGGATSFGSLISVGGGTAANSRLGGSSAITVTTSFYGGRGSNETLYNGASGGSGTAVASRDAGTAGVGRTETYIVGYQTPAGTGIAGGTAATSGVGGTADAGAAGGSGTGWIGGGGAAGNVYSPGGASANIVGNASAGGGGAGGGGASAAMRTSTAGTYVITAGDGGNAAPGSGAGGGGGGGYAWASGGSTSGTTSLTLTAGKGGNGGSGFLVVITVR
mgnify:CR=1 FL=1|tara:strand:+ start:13214 stop:14905 length:1692 start_codon:yes stop_codon:yes gene_type:complete